MKKLFYLAASALILSSCLDDGNFENDPMAPGILLYNAVTTQTQTATLDPFNVAFRFNTLLTECEGDLSAIETNEVLKDIRIALFGNGGLTITESGTAGNRTYRLAFNGGLNGNKDVKRMGVIEIETYATYLHENGAVWSIKIPENAPYTIFPDKTATSSVKISSNLYQIRNNGTNLWNISISSLKALPKTAAGEGSKSEWTGEYTVKQEGGTQAYADITAENRIYSLSFNASGKPMGLGVDIETKTTSDLKYNASCKTISFVGEGAFSAWDKNEPFYILECQWLGNDPTVCNPKVRLTWDGETKEYQPGID